MTRELVFFRSPDGTRIGAFKGGLGPPLVLVHGTTSDHLRWNVTLPRLEARFTCYALDRRGRGASDDSPTYTIEREYEDIATVVESIGGTVDLLGHSLGGLCAMEAALRTDKVRRLILYEPAAFIPGSGVYGDDVLERLEWSLAIGDREGLVASMLRDVAGVPASTIEILRRQTYWKNRLATAHTIPRELRADQRYRIDPGRLSRIRCPTLLLVGGNSPLFYRNATQVLHQAIPQSKVVEFPGHDHAAMDTAPRLFVDAVLNFLTED